MTEDNFSWKGHFGLKFFMKSHSYFNAYSKIWPPLAANFLALWVLEVVYMRAIQNDRYSKWHVSINYLCDFFAEMSLQIALLPLLGHNISWKRSGMKIWMLFQKGLESIMKGLVQVCVQSLSILGVASVWPIMRRKHITCVCWRET